MRSLLRIWLLLVIYSCQDREPDLMQEIPVSIPMKVEAVTVIPKPVAFEIYADGVARVRGQHALSFVTSGRIAEIRMKPGSFVQSGDTLARLDDTAGRLGLHQARILLEEARYAYESAMLSYRRRDEKVPDTVRKSVWHASGLARAEAEYELRRLSWNRHFLIAPVDGIISGIDRGAGDYIAPGEVISRLYHPSRLQVMAHVLELHAGRVKPGMPATLMNLKGDEVGGRVVAVDEWVDEDGFFKVWIRPEAPVVWPGGHVTVNLQYRQHRGLVVPVKAVMSRSDRLMVYMLENGMAQWRYIRGGLQTREYLEVLEGLKAGDTVLVSRLAELGHGMPVSPDLIEIAGR